MVLIVIVLIVIAVAVVVVTLIREVLITRVITKEITLLKEVQTPLSTIIIEDKILKIQAITNTINKIFNLKTTVTIEIIITIIPINLAPTMMKNSNNPKELLNLHLQAMIITEEIQILQM